MFASWGFTLLNDLKKLAMMLKANEIWYEMLPERQCKPGNYRTRARVIWKCEPSLIDWRKMVFEGNNSSSNVEVGWISFWVQLSSIPDVEPTADSRKMCQRTITVNTQRSRWVDRLCSRAERCGKQNMYACISAGSAVNIIHVFFSFPRQHLHGGAVAPVGHRLSEYCQRKPLGWPATRSS